MTPEERHEKMIRDYHDSPYTMQELMIITIREAEQDERQRCAKIICPGCRSGYPFERGGRDHRQPNGYVAGCAAYSILHS